MTKRVVINSNIFAEAPHPTNIYFSANISRNMSTFETVLHLKSRSSYFVCPRMYIVLIFATALSFMILMVC